MALLSVFKGNKGSEVESKLAIPFPFIYRMFLVMVILSMKYSSSNNASCQNNMDSNAYYPSYNCNHLGFPSGLDNSSPVHLLHITAKQMLLL
ncbi:hypothetical protein BJX66DRAFT_320617 [Aspergillus keveii]|uniref:Uncharacterized protein n=1 Tax=Aspergillus keveii TaxID=714993 RepID=A0ABR4FGV5_9EURO